MNNDELVVVEGVSKKFCKDLKKSLWYGIQDIYNEFNTNSSSTNKLREDEFWAVKDITFRLRRGECLGLMGCNGAGKSTLLKLLNGLIKPDKGTIEISGRVCAMIELAAGFNPILTGRENIYIYGATLGLSKKEIEDKFDAIVEFAEIGEFLDTPVGNYSSGMKTRLGFAISVQIDPDVLIVDEVLAVGDIGFNAKCFNRISEIYQNTVIIFVSHSIPQIARVANKICVLDKGSMVFYENNIPKGINMYTALFGEATKSITGNGKAVIDKIVVSVNDKETNEFHYLDDVSVHIEAYIDKDTPNPVCCILILNHHMQVVAQCDSSFNRIKIKNDGEKIYMDILLSALNLNPGNYYMSVSIMDESRIEVLSQHYAAKFLTVIGDFVGMAPIQLNGKWMSRQS